MSEIFNPVSDEFLRDVVPSVYGATVQSMARELIELRALCRAEPVAHARAWFVAGETPQKELKDNGRWAWPTKFKMKPLTSSKISADDIPLIPQPKEPSDG